MQRRSRSPMVAGAAAPAAIVPAPAARAPQTSALPTALLVRSMTTIGHIIEITPVKSPAPAALPAVALQVMDLHLGRNHQLTMTDATALSAAGEMLLPAPAPGPGLSRFARLLAPAPAPSPAHVVAADPNNPVLCMTASGPADCGRPAFGGVGSLGGPNQNGGTMASSGWLTSGECSTAAVCLRPICEGSALCLQTDGAQQR